MAYANPAAWYCDSVQWSAVAAWASGTPAAGALCRQAAAPTVGNERVFVCILSVGSQATEPAWTVTKGAVTTDGAGNKWQEITGQPGVNGDTTNSPVWTVSSTPPLGLVIYVASNSSLQLCSTSGAGGTGSIPAFSATAGVTTADASATWTSLGLASAFVKWKAPHARLANALATNWAAAGNTIFVGDDHAETQASAITIGGPAISYIYCVDHTASVPPGSANLRTTGTVSTTGAFAISFSTGNQFPYIYGLIFNSGAGINVGSAGGSGGGRFDSCTLALNNATGGSAIAIPINTSRGGAVLLNNTILSFGAVGQSVIVCGARTVWRNTASAIGGTVPTTLFGASAQAPGTLLCDGVDLSAAGAGNTLVGNAASGLNAAFVNCKFGASVTVAATPGMRGLSVDVIVSDSAGTTYQQQRYLYDGTLLPSTTIVRTGGASNGVTPIAWNITTTANATWQFPAESFPISIWNTTLSTNRGVTLHGVWNSASLPNNDQIWVDVEYLGSSGSPIASLASQTKANGLTAGAALTADSTSTWSSAATARANTTAYVVGNAISVPGASGGGGLFFCTANGASASSQPGGYATAVDGGLVTDGSATFRAATRFVLSVTLSSPQPALVGQIRATIKAALPTTTFYVDPLITLS